MPLQKPSCQQTVIAGDRHAPLVLLSLCALLPCSFATAFLAATKNTRRESQPARASQGGVRRWLGLEGGGVLLVPHLDGPTSERREEKKTTRNELQTRARDAGGITETGEQAKPGGARRRSEAFARRWRRAGMGWDGNGQDPLQRWSLGSLTLWPILEEGGACEGRGEGGQQQEECCRPQQHSVEPLLRPEATGVRPEPGTKSSLPWQPLASSCCTGARWEGCWEGCCLGGEGRGWDGGQANNTASLPSSPHLPPALPCHTLTEAESRRSMLTPGRAAPRRHPPSHLPSNPSRRPSLCPSGSFPSPFQAMIGGKGRCTATPPVQLHPRWFLDLRHEVAAHRRGPTRWACFERSQAPPPLPPPASILVVGSRSCTLVFTLFPLLLSQQGSLAALPG